MKPKAVIEYSQTKQGIDLSDQMSSYHSPLRRSLRWFHKLAIEVLLGLSIVNAHCLFNTRQSITGGEQMSITAFRESICNSLLGISNNSFANQCHIPASQSSSDTEPDSVHVLRECSEVAGDKTDAGDVIV